MKLAALYALFKLVGYANYNFNAEPCNICMFHAAPCAPLMPPPLPHALSCVPTGASEMKGLGDTGAFFENVAPSGI